MFYHAFDGYMNNAFPLDELRPLSCQGEDTLGGYALTLVNFYVLTLSCVRLSIMLNLTVVLVAFV